MADKYLSWDDALKAKKEIEATVVSSGVSEAGDVVALDANGLIDPSLLPTTGTTSYVAFEDIDANDLVNKFNDGGTIKIIKADAANGRVAHGFVTSAVLTGASGNVFTEGVVSGQSFAVADAGSPVFISSAGGTTLDCTTIGAGEYLQHIGCVNSATSFVFEPGEPIVRA